MISPQPVTTTIRRVNAALLGSREAIDAFADEMLAQERDREAQAKADKSNRAAAEADEYFTEGRRHRRPDRINPHE
jgi:hypothetical protein